MEEEISPAAIKSMRNLLPYKNKTDEELKEILRRKAEVKKSKPSTSKKYEERFAEKFDQLSAEYAVDMNNSNDLETVKVLVDLSIQIEDISRDIREIQDQASKNKDDYMALDKLGDIQRKSLSAYKDLQESLGISRKVRKEKQTDDIPKFVENLLDKAETFWEASTTAVECPTCKIELARLWINFPKLSNDIQLSLQCFRCEEKVEFAEWSQ